MLAVIVVLSLIAIIATPIITDVIADSKQAVAEQSASNYFKTIKTSTLKREMRDQIKASDGMYKVASNGNICFYESNTNCIEVNTEGTKPSSGVIYIKDGSILDGSFITINEYTFNYINSELEKGTYNLSTQIGTSIKYDPVADDVCTTGATCYDWYLLENKGTDYAYVSLIMDRNIADDVAWCSDTELCKVDGSWNNEKGPITANNTLLASTSDWAVLATIPQKSQTRSDCDNDSDQSDRDWLYGNLRNQGGIISESYGYWSSTPYSGNQTQAGQLSYVNTFDNLSINLGNGYGIRPVIAVAKSKLS